MVFLTIGRRLGALVLLVMLAAACSGQSKADKLYEQGVLLQKNQKYSAAIDKYEQALKIEQQSRLTPSVRLRLMLSEAYQSIGKPDQTIDYAKQALALKDINGQQKADAWVRIGQAQLMRAIAKRQPGAGGKPQYDKDCMAEAAKAVAEVRKASPGSMDASLLEARLDYMNGRIDEAERTLRSILKSDPGSLTATQRLVEILIDRKNYAEAEKLAREGLKAQKQPSPELVSQLAASLKGQQRYREAYDTIFPLIDPASKDSDALQLSQHLLAGDILLTQIDSLRTKRATADNIATSNTLKAELDQAVKQLADLGTSMKGRYPKSPESFFIRGVSYEMQGNWNSAADEYQKAVENASNSRPYRLALAVAQMQKKDYGLARQELRTILRESPGDREARLRIAQTYLLEGANKDALDMLLPLQNEKPDDRQVAALIARAKDMSGSPDVDALLEEARSLAQKGDQKGAAAAVLRAEKALKDKVAKKPGDAAPLVKLAEIAMGHNNAIDALAYARKAAAIDKANLLIEAEILSQIGRTDAAIALYEEAMKARPDGWKIEGKVAELEARAGRTTDSLARFERVRRDHPDQSALTIGQAVVLISKDPQQALNFLAGHEGDYPNDLSYQIAYARMLVQAERYNEAIDRLSRAVEVGIQRIKDLSVKPEAQLRKQAETIRRQWVPYQVELAIAQLLADRAEDALKTIEKARAEFPADMPNYSGEFEAIGLVKLGKPKDAAMAAESIRSIKPQPFSLPLVVSLIELAAGNQQQALKTVMEANQLTTDGLQMYRGMADKVMAGGAARQAAADLALCIALANQPIFGPAALRQADKALSALPDEPFVVARKVEVLNTLGRYEESLTLLRRLVANVPDPTTVMLSIADAHVALAQRARGEGNAREADAQEAEGLKACRTILAREPRNATVLTYMASIIQRQGKDDEANGIYRKLIAIDPDNWHAYNNLAWNLFEAGRLDQAAEDSEKALKLAPENGGVQDTAGIIALRRNQPDKALKLLREAAVRMPNEPSIRHHLAEALERAGQKDEAARQLELIVMAAPKYKDIDKVRDQLRRLSPKSELLTEK
ncbi:tetratricopeptide repeat protein [bacterium]|nr:tetratricopeptide repeat protein [bacterium]